jgi:hypothetical protein
MLAQLRRWRPLSNVGDVSSAGHLWGSSEHISPYLHQILIPTDVHRLKFKALGSTMLAHIPVEAAVTGGRYRVV